MLALRYFFAIIILLTLSSLTVLVCINGKDFTTIDSQNDSSNKSKLQYSIATFSWFTICAIGLTYSFFWLTFMLKKISLGNMIIRRTKSQFNVLFGLLITCYIIRVLFDILLVTQVFGKVVED